MDVVGTEIGQKMRSAIKAKLTELGCYVDDELPDYVMVMVANKRTRAQMEDDLQLFLGDNTELFVNWLHQVLKKLQEVTVTAPLNPTERDKSKECSLPKELKEKRSKDKKEKVRSKKGEGVKKKKKKDKEKLHHKKDEKRAHKSKKKSKHHEMIRPNVPPLLMNMEKESEPSITDVFAGQILKNHGITIEAPKEIPKEKKPLLDELKRPACHIIDPDTITSQLEPSQSISEINKDSQELTQRASVSSQGPPRDEQIKEMNEIEAKILGLKQKLAEQLDSMSDDEDFLNIRTEAEELMNDFAEDVFQEITQTAPPETPPVRVQKSPSPVPPPIQKSVEVPKGFTPPKETIETLPQIELNLPKRPQIELNLPKRPIRERLGARDEPKKIIAKEKEAEKVESPERFTPEREPDVRSQSKSAKSRLGDPPEDKKKTSTADESSDKTETSFKRLTSKVSVLERSSAAGRSSCASVVRVRPRPRGAAPAPSLLLRAVADAHKSLLNIPPKVEAEPPKVKRALVLPMRRCVDAQKIVIEVPADEARAHSDDAISLGDAESDTDEKSFKTISDFITKDEYIPTPITKKITNTDYVPSRRGNVEGRTTSRRDDTLIIETINIHNTTVDKQKDTQFIVTMDGYHPNAFLAKKLMTEGILDDDDMTKGKPREQTVIRTGELSDKTREKEKRNEKELERKRGDDMKIEMDMKKDVNKVYHKDTVETSDNSPDAKNTGLVLQKRLSNTSDESDTQVIINQGNEAETRKISEPTQTQEQSPTTKKRKASPIIFNVDKRERKDRERTESASSDNHVIVTTTTNSHKYDSLPPLPPSGPGAGAGSGAAPLGGGVGVGVGAGVPERKAVACRSFPLCRYGAACAFAHPRCKFAAACTRRNCAYAHPPHARLAHASPALASHVVPAANYKSISSAAVANMCKYYPSCANPACHYYHPKPCRYGQACVNKLECNFYHNDVPAASAKWRYPL